MARELSLDQAIDGLKFIDASCRDVLSNRQNLTPRGLMQ